MATKIKKGEFIGVGCGIQAIGAIALFWVPFGTIAGVIALIVGGRMAFKLLCSECGNRVEKTSKLCPHCSAKFT